MYTNNFPPDDSNDPFYLAHFGDALFSLYKNTGDLEALKQAVARYEQALELTPDDHPDRPMVLNNLGDAFLSLYERTGDQKLFDRALDSYNQALAFIPDDHPDRPAWFGGLGNTFLSLYERTGDQKALEQARSVLNKALDAVPEDHPDRPALLSNWGNVLLFSHERTGDLRTLEKAIDYFRQALELTPKSYLYRPFILNNLGDALLSLYKTVGGRQTLEKAIEILGKAADSTPVDHPARPSILNNLGNALLADYEDGSRHQALERAIDYYNQALELTPDDHPARPNILNNLGNALLALYGLTGEREVLDEAIARYTQALELAPDNHPVRPALLGNLGNALRSLYRIIGDRQTLEKAIEILDKAADSARGNHPHRPTRLNNLGNALLTRYEDAGGDRPTLDRAITTLRDALSLTSKNHPVRPNILNNLGIALLADYEDRGRHQALEQAIACFREALELALENHSNRHSYLGNLGNALLAFYRLIGDKGDLDEAIARYEQALELTPEHHPDRPGWLKNLGNAYRARYEIIYDHQTLGLAISNYRAALRSGAATNPYAAFAAGGTWAKDAFGREGWSEVVEAGNLTQVVLKNFLFYQTDRRDLTHTLSEFQNLPALAAWAQVELGNYQEAVIVLESGRTFVLREILERGRRDIERLPALGYRDLYERFKKAEQEVQKLERVSFEHRPPDWLSRMNKAREELERAAGDIREKVGDRHPEYRFLMSPLPFSEIQGLAASAPLVYLFATSKGGRALVVRKEGEPQVVRLPRLTERGLLWVFRGKGDEPGSAPDPESYYGAYDDWRKEDGPEKRKAWFGAIESALDFLGEALAPLREFLDRGGYDRVTLIPAGILAALPLHAARFEDGTYFLERHTFAYAPSAHALYYACLAEKGSESEPLLAVENPNGNLAYATLEVEAVRGHFTRVEHFAREEATVEAVKGALPGAGIFHFSGHGAGGWGGEEPRLQLADGVLTFSELLRSGQTLDRLRLAVLSACETGLADVRAFDEFLGLPAGFLLAGAPGVVGSLWSVPDVETALLIVRFYEKLCSGKADSGKVDAAEALREAQTWMLRMSPEEKHASLARLDAKLGNSALAGTRMSLEAAEGPSDLIESGGRKVKHPYYWAAFGYYGVPVELERCGNRREG